MRTCPACSSPCEEGHRFCPSCGFPIAQVQQKGPDPLIGRTLPGGYVLLELIGVGGMGRVYRAEQQALGRTVAVKVIHAHLLDDESASARFITEARAASRLNHPNSVGVIDFGKSDDGQLYLVMEFLRGRDLGFVAQGEGPLPFRRIVDVLRQTLAALGEAHELGIIHRDVKPENIILERVRGGGDFVKVVDFGLAKLMVGARREALTLPGIVCGTPDYMAPEQGRGENIDPRADLYALGVVLFALLTGRLPFEAESPTQLVLMHMSTPPPDPRRVAANRGIPAALAEACLRALAKSPDDRYQSADEFSSALGEALESFEFGPRPPLTSASGATFDVVVCGQCWHPNPRGQKFCGECGARLPASLAPEEAEKRAHALTQPAAMPTSMPASVPLGMSTTPGSLPLPFAEREDDLAWLDECRVGVRGTLLGARLVADEGFGKTRLLHEFLTIARAAGDRVVEVGPDPWWADVGCWTLRQLVQKLAELPPNGNEQAWAGASTEARRGLSELFGGRVSSSNGGGEALAPEARRYLAAEALRWALTRATQTAGRHRVVLVVEDLHRVDGASRNALSDALLEPPLAPVLLLATHAPGFDPGWGDEGLARSLSGLSPASVVGLLGQASSGQGNDEALASGQGVPPMYVEQLLRFLQEGGGDPPTRLVDVVSQRIERLGASRRCLLQALAVLGDNAERSELARLLPDDTTHDQGLRRLVRAGMVVEGPGPRLRIAHPLLREVVAASTPVAVRRSLHAAALDLLQGRPDVPVEVHALHAVSAEDAFEALVLLDRVASAASSRGDYAGAVLALRRGLELARREFFRGELDDPTQAAVVFGCKLGEALTQMGNYTDADGVLREALDLGGPLNPERPRVLGALAQVALGRRRAPEAAHLLRQAIEAAERAGAFDLLRSLEDLRSDLSLPT
ncbi:MAG: protein kinase [Polyangiaceae bacterium]|jgi:serine/threonine-protein kinase|nr:protein kinase [Polyangiaceae bacterium]